MRGMVSSVMWVALAYAAAVAVPGFVLLTLASGYGFAFLGIWEPPATERFRAITVSGGFLSLIVCLVVSTAGMIGGVLWSRLALGPPLLFALLCLALLVRSWLS